MKTQKKKKTIMRAVLSCIIVSTMYSMQESESSLNHATKKRKSMREAKPISLSDDRTLTSGEDFHDLQRKDSNRERAALDFLNHLQIPEFSNESLKKVTFDELKHEVSPRGSIDCVDDSARKAPWSEDSVRALQSPKKLNMNRLLEKLKTLSLKR